MKKTVKSAALFCSALLLSAGVGKIPGSPIHVYDKVMAEESDVQTLIDLKFDDQTTGGFESYKEGGDYDLLNENGELVCSIRSCGKVDYANQAYYDGFSLQEGCAYHISFDIRCDIERKIAYRAQLNGGDYHAYYEEFIDIGPQQQHIDATFTMSETTDPAPRLCFNMGVQDNMTEDPGEHNIYIDNIQLVLMDASRSVAEKEDETHFLGINQVGYRPDDCKTVVAAGNLAGEKFEIFPAGSQDAVCTGAFTEAVYDEATGQEVCHGDFSSLDKEGNYTIRTSESEASFIISDTAYQDLQSFAFQMLLMQRCQELPEELAGPYAHPACHTQEALIYGTDQTKEVSGGWHDAGDYGRYVVSGVKTAADLMLAYELGCGQEWTMSDQLGIPESGNGIPDILDEVRFELEWLLKMQAESGGVYHKVTGRNFPGVVMPQDETDELVLAPVSAAATGDFAAIMAKASVLYQSIDQEFSDNCKNAAGAAWNYLMTANGLTGFRNPSDIVTGEYPDDKIQDEILWAAAELSLLGDEAFTDTLAASPEIILKDLIETETASGLGWAEVSDYARYTIAKAGDIDTLAQESQMAKQQLLAQAEQLAEKAASDGYFCTLGTDYFWGSNMNVANNAMLLIMADSLSDEVQYKTTAKQQLDYLLGVNGMGYCYVTGVGTRSTEDPHHRPSQYAGRAVPGMLSGGPNKNLEDPYAKQVLQGKAPGLCYVDNQQSYSVNEVAIYWNSPLIALLAGI